MQVERTPLRTADGGYILSVSRRWGGRALLLALLVLLTMPPAVQARRSHHRATFTGHHGRSAVSLARHWQKVLARPLPRVVSLQDAYSAASVAARDLGSPQRWETQQDGTLRPVGPCTPTLELRDDLLMADGVNASARADFLTCTILARSDLQALLTTSAGRRSVCTGLAHEFGHLILGPQHTETGLMAPVVEDGQQVPAACRLWAAASG